MICPGCKQMTLFSPCPGCGAEVRPNAAMLAGAKRSQKARWFREKYQKPPPIGRAAMSEEEWMARETRIAGVAQEARRMLAAMATNTEEKKI